MVNKKQLANRLQRIGLLASTAAMTALSFPFNSYAIFDTSEIEINPGEIDAQTIIGRLLGLIAGIFIVVGIFRCGTAIFQILEAYSEDNSSGINKGVKQLAIGAAFIAAPALLMFLFG